ncbi:MAG: orotidine-5'-phosphate decarboxylase [Candidatus Thioglobus sp. MED-G25]|nr:MAG: orotidine-5'-phosphate decarboxylase [Candidatus Thioglobus sp. MED-G25]
MRFVTSKAEIPASDRLIVALDVPTISAAKELVTVLDDAVVFYKVGLELFMSGGAFELVTWLRERDKKVFVDLKFFDVPATVGRAVSQLNGLGITFATIHGNDAIMQAAAASAEDVDILAVTVLTSLDRGDLSDLGFECDVSELVVSRARRAVVHGCAGVVASGQEAALLRRELGNTLLVVVPGIRPVDNQDDQKRTVSAEQALRDGADYLVVGRPIRDANDPKAAAEQIQEEIYQTVAS